MNTRVSHQKTCSHIEIIQAITKAVRGKKPKKDFLILLVN